MKLTGGSSPYLHSGEGSGRLMGHVALALLPALAVGVWRLGAAALWVVLTCCGGALVAEWALTRRASASAAVTGFLLALTLPHTVPLWLSGAGGAFAVVAGKLLWGGTGRNGFNPALLARAAMVLCFPYELTHYTADVWTSATPLHRMAQGEFPEEDLLTLFLAQRSGSIGELSTLALLLGGGYLLWRRVITWQIPAGFLLALALLSLGDGLQWMAAQLLSGGAVLAAIFMATDYATSPVTAQGRLLYGVLAGAVTAVFRHIGIFPEGVTYALLLLAPLSFRLDEATMPRRFGVRRERQ